MQPKDTIFRFSFGEGNGTTSLDDTGRFTATLQGSGGTWTTDTPGGVPGYSINLNGSSYLTVAPANSGASPILFQNTISDFTLGMWVKPKTQFPDGANNGRFFNAIGGGQTFDFLYQSGSSTVGLIFNGFNSTHAVPALNGSTGGYNNSGWHLVVLRVAVNANAMDVFIDGVNVWSPGGPAFLNALGTTVFNIGSYPTYLSGSTLNAKIFRPFYSNRALPTVEIQAMYNLSSPAVSMSAKLGPIITVVDGGQSGLSTEESSHLRNPAGSGPTQYVHTWTQGYPGSSNANVSSSQLSSIWMGFSPDGLNINPASVRRIMGMGTNFAGNTGRSGLLIDSDGTWVLTFNDPSSGNTRLWCSTSTNQGTTWTTPIILLSTDSNNSSGAANMPTSPYAMSTCENSQMIRLPSGVYELWCDGWDGQAWIEWKFTSSSRSGPFAVSNSGSPILLDPNLTVASGYSYGSPFVAVINGIWYAVWHSSLPGSTGQEYSQVYMSQSSDGINFTMMNDGMPLSGISTDNEWQQFADPWLLIAPNGLVLYYSIVNNFTNNLYARVGAQVFNGTFAQWINDGSTPPDYLAGTASSTINNGSGNFASGGSATTTPQGAFGN